MTWLDANIPRDLVVRLILSYSVRPSPSFANHPLNPSFLTGLLSTSLFRSFRISLSAMLISEKDLARAEETRLPSPKTFQSKGAIRDEA